MPHRRGHRHSPPFAQLAVRRRFLRRILHPRKSARPERRFRLALSHRHPFERRRLGQLHRPIRRHFRPHDRRLANWQAFAAAAPFPCPSSALASRRSGQLRPHARLLQAFWRQAIGSGSAASELGNSA